MKKDSVEYFKGRGEHSVFQLEKMVEERDEFIRDLKLENQTLASELDIIKYEIIPTEHECPDCGSHRYEVGCDNEMECLDCGTEWEA
jgi:hypothetical protein